MRHRSIVTIYGRALTAQELFIVLEDLEGEIWPSSSVQKVEIGLDVRIRSNFLFSSVLFISHAHLLIIILALQATRSVHYLHSLHLPVLH